MAKFKELIQTPPMPEGDAEQQVGALRDYILRVVEELQYLLTHLEAENIDDTTFQKIAEMIPKASVTAPPMDGQGRTGGSSAYARADHQHPEDTNKADVTALDAETAAREAHEADTGNPHGVTAAQVGLGNVANERQYSAQNPPPIPTPAEVGAIPSSEKGSAGGVAELDSNGMVPSAQLPSYVDDVLNYPTLADFPAIGEDGKIYVAKDTNRQYRWSGSDYVEISKSLALGETSSTAYRGDRGKAAYDHSQVTSGNPHNVTAAEVGARPDTWTPSTSDVGAQPTITASGMLKGDGLGGVSAATAGTDYQAPLTAGVDYQTPLAAGTDYQTPLVAGIDYATPAQIPTVPDPSDAAPQDLGTGAAGSSGDYSRADHVHNLPDADDIGYDNTGSGLMATDVQAAIDEIAQGGGGGGTAASAVSYDNTGSGLTATNVQDAIDEVYGDIPTQASDIGAQDTITASGILKGDGAGGISAATPGTDYQTPLTAGTDYATPAQLDGKANQAQLATVETGSTASQAYAVGEYFCWNGLLYRAKTAISSGGTFTPGTNCEQVTVGAELASINSKTCSIYASASQTVTITMSGIAAVIMSVSGSNEARTGFYILQSSSAVAAGKYASVIKAASSITLTATSNGWTITMGTGGRTFSFIVMQGEITGLTAI